MPDSHIDELAALWGSLFSEAPSSAAIDSLSNLMKHNSFTDIVMAVSITASRVHIANEMERLKYLSGILKNIRLAKVLPIKAAEKKELNKATFALEMHWRKQPRGTHYLEKWRLREWLKCCTVDEIKLVMDESEGLWGELRTEMDRLVEQRKAHAEQKKS